MKDGANIPRKLAVNVQRNIHIWIIAIIMDFFIVLFNANFIDITGWFPWSGDIATAHGAALLVLSFIFIIPIIYASIVYGLRGTLLTWFIFLVAVLPRMILEIVSLEDSLRFGLFALVALLLGLLISLARSAAMQEKALVKELSPKRWNSIARMLKIQENERKRIARELHDDTIQDLLVIVNHLHALEAGVHGDLPCETKERVEKVETEMLHVIDNMRKMSHGLGASVLDNTGLVPAVKWLAESMTQETGIRVIVTVNGREHKLKSEAEILIFRIAQEALSNIRRHSRATRAEITLDFAASDVKMTMRDNGCGFVLPENTKSKAAAGQMGLDIMKQRAKLLGGRLTIQSEPGQGTSVSVETGFL
ncbi:MAG: sensor histidine kinase [Dehalococcoidia bacterium]|nr:sensor histidine kinase [Dehalococcoidia bacterium]